MPSNVECAGQAKRERRRKRAETMSRWASYGLFMAAGAMLQHSWKYSEDMIVYHIIVLAAIAFGSEFLRLKVWSQGHE